MAEDKKINLFLDSGAFSAKTQGVTIDIQEYISFIKEHESVIEIYANLDVIGDPVATWKNQRIMENAGLHPIPCYHHGEDIKWLEKYLEKYEYIALGGMVKAGNKNLIQWLDRIFPQYICDEKGFPKVKIHGFGLTSLPLMLRYPWYSVDSTSWVITGRLGSIYIPRFRSGEWIYDEQSWKIAVSNRSPGIKEAGQHISTLSKKEREILLNYIHNKGYVLGKSEYKKENQDYELKENEKWTEKKPIDKKAKREVEIILEPGISNKYQLRDEMNIIYFLDLEKSMPEWPWAFKTQTTTSKGIF
ncbi:MAG: hypothetical protein WC933_03605 [Candidatus Paceibacterota bacterium]